jgi:hypothetical protein
MLTNSRHLVDAPEIGAAALPAGSRAAFTYPRRTLRPRGNSYPPIALGYGKICQPQTHLTLSQLKSNTAGN